jgi:hypothetical protein
MDVDTGVKIKDHILGLVALDGDFDAGDTSELNGLCWTSGATGTCATSSLNAPRSVGDICVGVEAAPGEGWRPTGVAVLRSAQHFSRLEIGRRELWTLMSRPLQDARSKS